jgi:hypothetical protein
MKPFSAIAISHRAILEGPLTMDVFAANLWEMYFNQCGFVQTAREGRI